MHYVGHHRSVRERIIASQIMKLEMRQAQERTLTRQAPSRARRPYVVRVR